MFKGFSQVYYPLKWLVISQFLLADIFDEYYVGKWINAYGFIDTPGVFTCLSHGFLWRLVHEQEQQRLFFQIWAKVIAEFQRVPSLKRIQEWCNDSWAHNDSKQREYRQFYGSMEESWIFSAFFGALRVSINSTQAQTKPGLKESTWPTCFFRERCDYPSLNIGRLKVQDFCLNSVITTGGLQFPNQLKSLINTITWRLRGH